MLLTGNELNKEENDIYEQKEGDSCRARYRHGCALPLTALNDYEQ